MLVAALGALGTLTGAWAWWQGSLERGFWILWRVTQLATTALAAVALIVFVAEYKPARGLFWLYMLLPIAVSIPSTAASFWISAARSAPARR